MHGEKEPSVDFRPDNIPEELKSLPCWLLWKPELREGRWTKVPYRVDDPSRKASTTDPQDWADFETAIAMAWPNRCGIGFVFSEDFGVVGIDFDDSLEDEGFLRWIKKFNSYAEISPSGNGYHVFVHGKIPRALKRKDVECYSKGRYFTVTGNQMEDVPNGLRHVNGELMEFYEEFGTKPIENRPQLAPQASSLGVEDILSLIRKSRQAEKFSSLYDGNSEAYPSASEADAAMLAILSFWCQNDSRLIREVALSSQRDRDKWSSKRGSQDWLEQQVEKAVERNTETYSPSFTKHKGEAAEKSAEKGWGVNHVSLDDVIPEDIEFLSDPYIPVSKVTLISGDGGIGKSSITLDWAYRVSKGVPFYGGKSNETKDPKNVVLMSAEDGLADTIVKKLITLGADRKRIHALTTKSGPNGEEEPLSLLDETIIDDVLTHLKPRLLVVDPIVSYLGGKDMNRADEVRSVMDVLNRLAQKHCCAVVVVRHLRKASGEKAAHSGAGSMDFHNAARSEMLVIRDDEKQRNLVVHIKSNLAEPGETLVYEIGDERQVIWLGTDTLTAADLGKKARSEKDDEYKDPTIKEQIINHLLEAVKRGPIPCKEFKKGMEEAGYSLNSVKRAVRELGLRTSNEEGKWFWIQR